ncbi:helix-turn-helix domain-containing protein [Massilia sp. MS-15]|uniref:helix-turn-helix domain-containing protein n=1 Tax=Massilia sp. MS-15 TaxID=2878200 RepID=UPI001CD50B5F|nr:helix-turn-helix transcriptional regulator [Massilia sp. MS-15]MCA1246826.1 helix-turn-helix domain-containing protein [Massilia sp. MS-15]
MNFGERLKQIRTGKGLTQPQFAEMAGIEQSYLSKLENDKSVPSAEMFDTIVSALGMDAATFLQEVDREVIDTTLRHIPSVTQFKAQAVMQQVQHTKRWLFGSAAAWMLGFAMMLAANDGIFFPNKLYKYTSQGVIRPGEAENVFRDQRQILELRMQAKLITYEEMTKALADFYERRLQPLTVESPENRGTGYYEAVENGRRRFELADTTHVKLPGNRILQYLGAIVFACGFVGLFIEWRLRRLKTKLAK